MPKLIEYLFMNMIRNNLNRMENYKRSLDFILGIKKYPIQLLSINLTFDVKNSYFEKITEKDLNFMKTEILKMSKKIFGEKIKIAFYSQIKWDLKDYIHAISIKFVIVGKTLKPKIKILEKNIEKFKDEVIGGNLKLRFIEKNNSSEVLIEIFPVQFEENLRDYEEFKNFNRYNKFYNEDLFRFLTSPMETY